MAALRSPPHAKMRVMSRRGASFVIALLLLLQGSTSCAPPPKDGTLVVYRPGEAVGVALPQVDLGLDAAWTGRRHVLTWSGQKGISALLVPTTSDEPSRPVLLAPGETTEDLSIAVVGDIAMVVWAWKSPTGERVLHARRLRDDATLLE